MASTETEFWDNMYDSGALAAQWTEIPQINEAVNVRMTGTNKHWLPWCFEDFFGGNTQASSLLSIGCGHGLHELVIARNEYAGRIEAFDGSRAAIEQAQAASEREGLGIQFRTQTFEEFLSEPSDQQDTDLILCTGSLHHVRPIEEMVVAIKNQLVPESGRLVFNEYIGPIYNIYSAERVATINAVLECIAPKYRLDAAPYVNPTMEMVKQSDPSEAVRSSLIMELLSIHFEFEYLRYYGGSLLMPLLTKLDRQALPPHNSDPDAAQLVRLLIHLERTLVETGRLAEDFAFGVCRPKAP